MPWRDRRGSVSPLKITALAIAAAPAVVMMNDWRTGSFGPLPVVSLVYWSGVWAAALLVATLAVTPARHVLRFSGLIEVRRILGLAGLLYSLVHLVTFFALLRWNWSAIFNQATGRVSLVVASVSLAGLLVLGATSTDGARWHRLHRLNAWVTGLAIGHFLLSPGIFSLQYTLAGLLFWLIGWRALRMSGASPGWPQLAALALASTLFVVLCETGWLWAWQRVPPAETLKTLVSFEDEIPPPWIVMAAGLAVIAVAVARGRLASVRA
jgi:sulfoxide reductase heme-binding subunit YedZ